MSRGYDMKRLDLSDLDVAVLELIEREIKWSKGRMGLQDYLREIVEKGWVSCVLTVGERFYEKHKEEIVERVARYGEIEGKNIFAVINEAPDREFYYKYVGGVRRRYDKFECVSSEDFKELISITALRIASIGLLSKMGLGILQEEAD